LSDCADLLLAAARRRLGADDRHGALVLLEELLRVQPDHAAALRLSAEQQAASNPAGALALVEQVLQHDPGDIEAHGLRARIASFMGRHDEAAHHFYALARARPDALALTNYAVSLLRAGDPLAAVETAERAIALVPAQAEAHAALGHGHNLLHRPEQAIGAFETALRLRPDFADALQGLARA
jgi:Tfp pilus assembly protein PilF